MRTTYRYKGSHTDLTKGEFRGFRTVEETGPGDPVVKITEFHRGSFPATGEEEDFRGRPQRVTRWVTAPRTELLHQTDFTYTRNGTEPLEAKQVLPESVTTAEVNFPRDGLQHYPTIDPAWKVERTETFGYDPYGNRTLSIVDGTGGPKLTIETPQRPPLTLTNGDLVQLPSGERRWSGGTLILDRSFEYFLAVDGAHRAGKLKSVTQTYCSMLDASDALRRADCFDPAVRLDYDALGRLNSVEEATSASTFRTLATISTIEDANGTTTTSSRTAGGVTLSRVTHQEWRFGLVDQVTDENGKVGRSTFDAFGRVLTQSSSSGSTDLGGGSVEYVDQDPTAAATGGTPSSRTVTTRLTATESAISKVYVDGLGRALRSVVKDEASGGPSLPHLHTVNQYDEAGRLLGTMGPFRAATDAIGEGLPTASGFSWSRTNYGLDGFVYGIVQSDGMQGSFGGSLSAATGPTTTFSYLGPLTTSTDPDGLVTESYRDYAGRIVKVREHGRDKPGDPVYGVPTEYTYRADGLLLSVLGPEGSCNDGSAPLARCLLTSITYDTLGRRIEVRDPTFKDPASVAAQGAAAPSLPWQYFFASNGEIDHLVAPSGATTSFTYDGFDRPLSKSFKPAGATTSARTESYTYDQTTDIDTQTVDFGLGRLGAVTIREGGVDVLVDRFHYDAAGRTRSMARTLLGESGTKLTRFDFDLGGRAKSMTYPDGTVLSYAYHRGTGVLSQLSGTALGAGVLQFKDFDPLGQPGTIVSDVTTRLTYDPWSGGLKRIKAGEVATALAADLTYTRTAAGLVRSLADARVAAPSVATFTYAYDDVGRLIGESVPMALPGDLSKSLALTYDNVVGRPSGLLSVTDPQRGAFEFAYDADGNVRSGVNLAGTTPTWRSFTYGADGMPSAIGTMGAFYDQGGERAIKRTCGAASCPATSTTYYFGPHYEIRNGVPTRYIFAGGQRMAKVDASGVWYLHKDQVGSTVAVTSGGQVRWRGSYQLLGALRTECATMGLEACAPTTTVTRPVLYLFGDHEYDTETGLYYYGARYYDPIVGRFTSPDTLVPRPFDPQSFNRYAFQRNDPLNRVDPDGHDDTLVLPPLHADCSIMVCGGGSGPGGWDQPDSFDGTFGSGPGMGGRYSGGGAPPVLAAPAGLAAVAAIAAPGAIGGVGAGAGGVGIGAGAGLSSAVLPLGLIVGGIAGSVALNDWADRTERSRTWITYTLRNPGSEQVYVGRASGFGTPTEILARRYSNHPLLRQAGFSIAKVDRVGYGYAGRLAIRGREQQMIDYYWDKGAGVNIIRGVSAINPMGLLYHWSANAQFGNMHEFTGYWTTSQYRKVFEAIGRLAP